MTVWVCVYVPTGAIEVFESEEAALARYDFVVWEKHRGKWRAVKPLVEGMYMLTEEEVHGWPSWLPPRSSDT